MQQHIATATRNAYHADKRQYRRYVRDLNRELEKETLIFKKLKPDGPQERRLPPTYMCKPASASILAKVGVVS